MRGLSSQAANRSGYVRSHNPFGYVVEILAWLPLDLAAYKQLGLQEDLRLNFTIFFAFAAFGYFVRVN